MGAQQADRRIANVLLVIMVLIHLLGVMYFRAQPPANTPEGMSIPVTMAALFVWYSSVAALGVASAVWRFRFVRRARGASRYLHGSLAVLTLLPVIAYVYVVYANLT